MKENRPKCSRCVGDTNCIKYGKDGRGKQRYLCKRCKTSFVESYVYSAYHSTTENRIIVLLKEGCGIRSISRILSISPTTTIRRILLIAEQLRKPMIAYGKSYEMDEMRTYIGIKKKLIWVAYAIRRDTKEVLDFSVGRRTNKTLKKVINRLILSEAKQVNTDKLRNYRYLIPDKVHRTKQYGTNHIERMNLTLRTHLKRLNRRTICFSRSIAMLSACLKIYFWG